MIATKDLKEAITDHLDGLILAIASSLKQLDNVDKWVEAVDLKVATAKDVFDIVGEPVTSIYRDPETGEVGVQVEFTAKGSHEELRAQRREQLARLRDNLICRCEGGVVLRINRIDDEVKDDNR